jgi:hypothetical protein
MQQGGDTGGLELSPEEMREPGYRVVDMPVERTLGSETSR